MKRLKLTRRQTAALTAMLAPATGAVFLLALRVLITGKDTFLFMLWNLTLSLFAVAAAVALNRYYRKKHKNFVLLFFLMWLFLLPNTFYMLTDLIHLGETSDINVLFDIVMLSLFALAGFVQGCVSLWLVHLPLIKRYGKANAHILTGCIILASSFAVDMGRYLRWNSWDVILHPQSLLFDVSDTFLNPLNYNRSFLITGVFFVATTSAYVAFLAGVTLLKGSYKVE